MVPEDLSDNESLRTSLPRQSPTPSVVSTTIMTAADEDGDEPPPYSAVNAGAPDPSGPVPSSWQNRDPRSASTQSLVPDETPEESGRRKLLLVYIHGFMGSETSFRSFPAHVHNLLAVLLAESHIVHTKIYPKYRSKKSLQIAAQQFSDWLEPHVSPITDVVLLGHSMGGLLASDIVLLPANPSASNRGPLRNRNIIGTINFDVPFLGMHPGVIASGIGSLFRPAQKSPASEQPPSNDASSLYSVTTQGSSSSDLRISSPSDPNYNPAYNNDNILPARTGLSNAAHFIKKHSKNLRQATKTLVTNHVEFGGAMADYEGLKLRYTRIRMLEEDLDQARATVVQDDRPPPRVRFTNYYTASTGRPKKATTPPSQPPNDNDADEVQRTLSTPEIGVEPVTPSNNSSSVNERNPQIEAEAEPEGLPPAYSDIDFTDSEDDDFSDDLEQLGRLDPIDSTETLESTGDLKHLHPIDSADSDYKPMPSLLPPPPPIFRPPFGALKDKEAYKAAYKDYKRQVRDHQKQIIAYHQSLVEFRKQEIARLKKYHKASVENLQATIDSRCNELTIRREQRRAEFEARREKLKQRIEEAKERRRVERETIREARKAKANKSAPTSGQPVPTDPEKRLLFCKETKSTVQPPARAPPAVPSNWKGAKREARADRREMRTEGRADRRLHRAINKAERKEVRALGRTDRKEARHALHADRHAQAHSLNKDNEQTFAGKGKSKKAQDYFPPHSEAGDTMFDVDGEDDAREHDDLSESDVETTPSRRVYTPETSPPSSRQPSVAPSILPTISAPPAFSSSTSYPNEKAGEKATKPKKDKKFCVLPPKDASGNRDPTWVRIYMEGVDEIGAHCGLFFTRGAEGQERTNADLGEAGSVGDDVWSERYAGLVGDVAERVEGWCLEGMTQRMVHGIGAL